MAPRGGRPTRQLRAGNPSVGRCAGVERGLPPPATRSGRPDSSRDRPGKCPVPASGHREGTAVWSSCTARARPRWMARRPSEGMVTRGRNQPAVHSIRPTPSNGSHNVKPRLPQRLGQTGPPARMTCWWPARRQDRTALLAAGRHFIAWRLREPSSRMIRAWAAGVRLVPCVNTRRPARAADRPRVISAAGSARSPVMVRSPSTQRAVHVDTEPGADASRSRTHTQPRDEAREPQTPRGRAGTRLVHPPAGAARPRSRDRAAAAAPAALRGC